MRALSCALCILLSTAPGLAQVRSLEIHKPRLFGYYIGDLIEDEIVIVVDNGVTLKESSLPAPGPLNYWLTLKAIQTSATPSSDGGTRYILKLTYQTFYDPLEPHWLKIPGFQLIFDKADQSSAAAAPEWSFLSSPIREVSPKESKDNMFIQPDVPPYDEYLSRDRNGVFGAGFAALASYLALAYGRAWPPFRLRPRRPFTDAARRLKSLMKTEVGEDVYRQALTLLHEAFNKTDGRVILADDLDSFLSGHQQFRIFEAEIAAFFAISRRMFFESDCAGAMNALSFGAVAALCQNLSAAERGLR
ncbi:nonribosomal peptide synthetase MxaA [Methylocapsa polymorpha]|uniref:Nonribosomal peptide synthetase MxaA n=1 Tax=Methylocapsa polymorpha TaxID=3080828 RepID=A0ABZ0HVU7_9HYPH|nr:nonribosomal peptide synthetase MxaA [Methylocapsa sp. RX1]